MVRVASRCLFALVALACLGFTFSPAVAYGQEREEPEGQRRSVDLAGDVEDVDFGGLAERFPEKFRYDRTRRTVSWYGTMEEGERDALLEASRSQLWRDAINRLYQSARRVSELEAGEGETITFLRFQGEALDETLRLFATDFNLNIIMSRGLTGNVEARLENIPVLQGLEIILQSQGLTYERIENPVDPTKDVFLIVQFERQPARSEVAIIDIPRPGANQVDLDFGQLVQQLSQIAQGGRVISNQAARILFIEARPEQIGLVRRYLQRVMENLPERDIDVEGERMPVTRPTEREEAGEEFEPERMIRNWYRLNPEPNFFEQALDELARLLGARPEVISDRHGIFLIEDTQDNLRLAEQHIRFLNNLRPGEDLVDPQRRETRVYTLKQSAATVADGIRPFLSQAREGQRAGRLVVNVQLNSLLVTDTAENLDELERYIRELDATPQQVLIESTILEATLDDSTDFGVQAFFQRDVGSSTVSYSPLGYNRGATPPGDSPFRSFSGSAYNLGFVVGNEWEVALQAIQTTLDANIVSRPKTVVANGREGVIEVGTVIPYIDVQGGAAGASQGVSFRDVLLRMSVTPHIEPGDRIRLILNIEFDARAGDAQLGGVGAGVPIISSRSIRTEVYVNDAETLVIGGLYEDRESQTVNKVPILGDLPLLGALFRNTSVQRQKTDLLFLITPTIVRDLTVRETFRDGRERRVFRPDGPQIPDWYTDHSHTRLRQVR